MIWGLRADYQFGPDMANLNLGMGVRNLLDHQYFTRAYDDNNKGIYVGEPRTLFLQGSVKF